jgi:energy-converting hydrogenase Eha subunit C
MDLIKALTDLWAGWNGKKFNTGAVVTILAIVLQQVFVKLNIGHDQAVGIATAVVEGVGAVIMVVGYIHRLIKAKQPAAKPVASQTPVNQG